jgi:hypothetical protein
MTKLDEAFTAMGGPKHWEIFTKKYQTSPELVIQDAARAFSALQKLAPEIGALVLELDIAHEYHIGVGRDGTYLEKKILSKRPTLKAIHDNLKMWGE